MSEATSKQWIKFVKPLLLSVIHLYHSAGEMMPAFESTHTYTLRYVLRSREIYTENQITFPEILLEPPTPLHLASPQA